MAPPDATVIHAVPTAAPPTPAPLKAILHPGPKPGTGLRGYAVKELNDFHYEAARTVELPPVDPAIEEGIKKTTQGVDAEPFTIVQGPQDFKASDFKGEANEHKWQYRITEEDIAEIEAALRHVEAKQISIEELTKEARDTRATTLRGATTLRV